MVAAANAGLLPTQQLVQPALVQQRYIQPQLAIAQPVLAKQVQVEDYDANPQYSFSYDVQDSLTGDSKNQQETRSGDVVQGSYSLLDADGYQRTVTYTADPVHGFNAVVQREPLVAKTLVKGVVAQPALVKSVVAQPALVKSVVAQPALVAQQQYIQPQIYAQQPQIYAQQPQVYAQQPIYRSAYSPIAVSQPLLKTQIGLGQAQLVRSPLAYGHL